MPRALRDYRAEEWRRLRPVTEAWKDLVGAGVNASFVRRPSPDPAAVEGAVEACRGRTVVVTVAWRSPWVLAWQLRSMRRFLRNAVHVVADNSGDHPAAAEIEALAAAHGTPYVRLPANPYRRLSQASRSHGLAMNWVCRNIVEPAEAPVFGFVDHDLLPMSPFDPAALVGDQPVHGRLIVRGDAWYLWAGYCFFRRDAVAGRRLDFRQDWSRNLDTGGRNEIHLYRFLDRHALRFEHWAGVPPVFEGDDMADLEWFDGCLHLGNASGWNPSAPDRRARLEAGLERLWAMLDEPPPAA